MLVAVLWVFLRFDRNPPDTMLLFIFLFSSFGIGAFLFGMRNPADGIFCVGISLLMMVQFESEMTGIRVNSAYFSGAAMGLIFAYIYGHAWSKRLLGLFALTPVALCLYIQRENKPLLVGVIVLYGAVPGSLVWVIRWVLRRRRGGLALSPPPRASLPASQEWESERTEPQAAPGDAEETPE
jgi:hypothetical protein